MSEYTIKELAKSQLEVELTISDSEVENQYKKSLQKISNDIQLKGFRKGKAPHNLVESAVGKDKVYQEALNSLLPEKLEEALKQESEKNKNKNIIVLDYPKFSTDTQWEKGKDWKVKAIITIYPKVDLDKFENNLKVAKPPKKDISEQEIDESINKIFEQYKKIKEHEAQEKKKNVVQNKENEAASIVDAQGNTLVSQPESSLQIDDTFAQYAGAKDVPHLRELVKQELQYLNEMESERTFEESVVQEALKLVEIDIPDLLVEEEVKRLEKRFVTQLERLGTTLENYLKAENKDTDSLRDEWKKQAHDNTKIALILSELRNKKQIPVSEEEIVQVVGNKAKINSLTEQQYMNVRYMIGQTKALNELKSMANKDQFTTGDSKGVEVEK